MRGITRTLGIALVMLAPAASGHGEDSSCGTIDTTGAVLETGAAPTQGQTLQMPCAREEDRPVIPALPEIGSIGTFTRAPGTYAPPPDISPAVPEEFHATSGFAIPAGDHVFAGFAIDPGVTVSVASGAEIWTTEDALIEGTLRFSGAGLFHCGGDFTIDGGEGSAGVQTGGTNGPVDIQVGGSFFCGSRDDVTSSRIGLRIETFGAPPTSGHIAIEGVVWAVQEDVLLSASGGIHITGDQSRVEVDYGTLGMRSYGGDIVLDSYASIRPADSDDAEPAVIEAAGSILMSGGAEIDCSNRCALQMSALGGDVHIHESNAYSAGETDDGWVRATGSVIVEGEDSYLDLDCGDHTVDVRAFGGAVEFRELEGETNESYIGGAVVTIAAATDVRLERVGVDAYANSGGAPTQSVSVRAHDGSILCDGRLRIGTQSSFPGKLTLHASDAIALACSSESRLRLQGSRGVEMFAGTGGIDLEAPFLHVLGGPAALRAEGPVVLDTDVQSLGDLSVVSTRSWVDTPGCSLVTVDTSDGTPSGDVLVESWAGASGRVDVSGATLRTGASTTQSGDVLLRVVQAGGAAELDAYLLPKKVKTKLGKKDVASSLMTLSGDLDLGTTGPDLRDSMTVRIGDLTFDLPGLTPNKAGNRLTHRDDVLDVTVRVDKRGSSRAKFTFKVRGDPLDVGDPDGTLPLGLACGDMDARCAVALADGNFARGKVRGAVVEPPVRLDQVKVVVKGPGRDKLSLKLGLNTGVQMPSTAPEVALGMGDEWDVLLQGDLFALKKQTFRFKGNEFGIRKVTVDYGKEALSVSGNGLDLGPHVGPDGLLRLRVRVAGEEFALRVRLRTKGATHSY